MRSDLVSLSAKLPQIGSRLTNKHGIKWTVHDHVRASNIATKPGDESELTCYPVIFPENLSERFDEFLAEVARCTPKIILPLDTMPSVFPNRSHVAGHSIDAWSHPEAIHVFIDAEDCSEVVLAHELAHAWIDFVKGIKDHRVWKDREDTGRYTQVQLMQSFVLDFAVHQCLEEKGFDQTQIRADWEVASMQLRVAAEHGYRPVNPREAIYMASHLAAVLVEESVSTLPVPLANSLPTVKRNLPEVFATASGLAEAVSNSFPSDRDSALKAIDSVLGQSFAFTDPGLDYSANLLYVEPEVDWEMDKTPDWLKGQPVRAKCEIGVTMARLGATSADTPVLSRTGNSLMEAFRRPDGTSTEAVLLKSAVAPPSADGEAVKRANERLEEMRQGRKRVNDMKKLLEPQNPGAMPARPVQAQGPNIPSSPQLPNVPGFRPRTYSPGMARWLTKVRMEEMLAGEHPYSYAANNPVSLTDPTGLRPIQRPDRPAPDRWPGNQCSIYHCKQNGGFRHEFVCTEGLGPGKDCSGGAYPGWNPCKPAIQGDTTYAGSCLSGAGPGPDEYTCKLISTSCKEAAEVCKELGKPMQGYWTNLFCIGYACRVRCSSCRAHPQGSQARKDCVCNRCNCGNYGGIKECLDPDGLFTTCGWWK